MSSPNTTVLNDVHSQLNPTSPREIARVSSLQDVQDLILNARANGMKISVAGGRHAMGGQQFAQDALHLDMSGLCRVLDVNPAAGSLHIEAGAEWPAIIAATHSMPGNWGIRQKQTGVDTVSLGGSISANAHGRGLSMQPIGDDIENLTLVTADGAVHVCGRAHNAELFSLAIGGYGLFGIIYSATLRLARRQRVRRVVDVIDLQDAMQTVQRRVTEGCVYGDFQFAIDPDDDRFLHHGVLACYKPGNVEPHESGTASDLTPDTWLQLLKLAHDDKKQAFRLYAQHYLGTDGNQYWSDTMQLSTYIPSYAEFLENTRTDATAPMVKETLVIGEHYVPPEHLLTFMQLARDVLRAHDCELIYGTIRAIQRDTVSFLPWAKEDLACVIFNLRTPHSAAGLQRTADCFRALIEAGTRLGGSFFLTYHRYASAAQVEACYPRFREWLSLKRRYDPDELFCSTWYQHYRAAFTALAGDVANVSAGSLQGAAS